MNNYFIILASGQSKRFNSPISKQFIEYKNKDNTFQILKSNCNNILNIKFGADLKNEIKAINKGKALEKILPDAWISKDIKDAKAFISWVKSSMFYDLTYNDNDEAIKMINKIL